MDEKDNPIRMARSFLAICVPMWAVIIALLCLCGCGGYRLSDECRQEVADSAATTIEWTEAVRAGVDPEAAATAIRALQEGVLHVLQAEYTPSTERQQTPDGASE